MTMHDPFEGRELCKDCGLQFHPEALSDGQCFTCWVKEAEAEDLYEILEPEDLEELLNEYIEGRLDNV